MGFFLDLSEVSFSGVVMTPATDIRHSGPAGPKDSGLDDSLERYN